SDELLESLLKLLVSLLKLLVVAAEKGEMYDRVIIESSGVSEPKNVRQTFFMMAAQQHPAFDYATLQEHPAFDYGTPQVLLARKG
ncbi:hypothetical protein T484DRAFT_1814523, partial [Baffinella frigidus]